MSATNRGRTRHPQDLYETPAWCTRAILRALDHLLPSACHALEPCAGNGAIVRELECEVTAIDITRGNPGFDGVLWVESDCTLHTGRMDGTPYDLLITNPPYRDDLLDPILRWMLVDQWQIATYKALLMRSNWATGGRKRDWIRRDHPFGLFTMSRRPSFVWKLWCAGKDPSREYVKRRGDGCGWSLDVSPGLELNRCQGCGGYVWKTTSDATEYAWCVWGPGMAGRWEPLDCDDSC